MPVARCTLWEKMVALALLLLPSLMQLYYCDAREYATAGKPPILYLNILSGDDLLPKSKREAPQGEKCDADSSQAGCRASTTSLEQASRDAGITSHPPVSTRNPAGSSNDEILPRFRSRTKSHGSRHDGKASTLREVLTKKRRKHKQRACMKGEQANAGENRLPTANPTDAAVQHQEEGEHKHAAPRASRPESKLNLLDSIRNSEDGLMFSGSNVLNDRKSDGILSFLSPKDVASMFMVNKLHSNTDEFGTKVASAAAVQAEQDRSLESRTENCEDLFLEVVRERIGNRKPRDYWNPQVDGHSDFLAKFQNRVEPRRRKQIASETDWSVLLLMSMAAETCSPLRSYSTSENGSATLQDRYASENLQKGCHAGDKDFFREVLDFFHAKVSRLDRTSERGRHVVIWNPPQEANGFNGTLAARAIASNPNRDLLDSRCRLAMATELLFQRHAVVYDTPFFFVKHGYCLNSDPDANVSDVEDEYSRQDPIDAAWYTSFRRLFRTYARQWRTESDGVNLRWSYDQFQWDWRSHHAARLQNTSYYDTRRKDDRRPPRILAANPGEFSVVIPTLRCSFQSIGKKR
ncbi:unnamed protein product [Amoebophrya sp. A120]|nr:unnamed protein product [Amoebophrya sp. A120]|eukprot:GSA120T00011828001.1